MLKIKEISFDYKRSPVFERITINVEKNHILAIVGPNGAGKTTLLKCVTGILTPGSGEVFIDDKNAHLMRHRELAKYLAYVPQNIPVGFPASVFEMVLAGRCPHISWRPSKYDLEITAAIIDEMNLTDLAMRDIGQISGGQAQKVLLARALAQETPYLLLDEPTSSLDLRHQLELLGSIEKLAKERGLGIMIAMHDLSLASRFSDTIVMLHQGKIFCSGRPSKVMTTENIAEVYGVEAAVLHENGYLHIQPLRCT